MTAGAIFQVLKLFVRNAFISATIIVNSQKSVFTPIEKHTFNKYNLSSRSFPRDNFKKKQTSWARLLEGELALTQS